jgi:hypothetical protein
MGGELKLTANVPEGTSFWVAIMRGVLLVLATAPVANGDHFSVPVVKPVRTQQNDSRT